MPKNTKERKALVEAKEAAEQRLADASDDVADAQAEVRNAEQRLKDAYSAMRAAGDSLYEYDMAAKAKAPLRVTLIRYLHMASMRSGAHFMWSETKKRLAFHELEALGFVKIGQVSMGSPKQVTITDLGRAKLREEKARAKQR